MAPASAAQFQPQILEAASSPLLVTERSSAAVSRRFQLARKALPIWKRRLTAEQLSEQLLSSVLREGSSYHQKGGLCHERVGQEVLAAPRGGCLTSVAAARAPPSFDDRVFGYEIGCQICDHGVYPEVLPALAAIDAEKVEKNGRIAPFVPLLVVAWTKNEHINCSNSEHRFRLLDNGATAIQFSSRREKIVFHGGDREMMECCCKLDRGENGEKGDKKSGQKICGFEIAFRYAQYGDRRKRQGDLSSFRGHYKFS